MTTVDKRKLVMNETHASPVLPTKVYVDDLQSATKIVSVGSGLKGTKLKTIQAFGAKKIIPF